MPAVHAERLEAVQGGVNPGRVMEGGDPAHAGLAASRAAHGSPVS